MASFKVGDKVRIKTRKELLKAGFQPSQRDKDEVLHRDGNRVLLWGSEAKLYCGEEAVVTEIRISEGVPIYEVFTVKDNKRIYNLDGDSIESLYDSEVEFIEAFKYLEAKKCDAIKFASNVVVGAYLKEGKLYKARIRPHGDSSHIEYTDEVFEMYAEYVTGKWTVHTDQFLKGCIKQATATINNNLSVLTDLGVLSEEDVKQIQSILQK